MNRERDTACDLESTDHAAQTHTLLMILVRCRREHDSDALPGARSRVTAARCEGEGRPRSDRAAASQRACSGIPCAGTSTALGTTAAAQTCPLGSRTRTGTTAPKALHVWQHCAIPAPPSQPLSITVKQVVTPRWTHLGDLGRSCQAGAVEKRQHFRQHASQGPTPSALALPLPRHQI